MNESVDIVSNFKKAAPWYGVVAFGGILLAVSMNLSPLIDRYYSSLEEMKVVSIQAGSMKVKPDFAEVTVTAKQILGSSAKTASGDLYQKVKAFSEFLTPMKDTTFSLLPLTVSHDLLQVGSKYARNYVAQQEFKIKTMDVSMLKSITEKAVELELGNIDSSLFKLKHDHPAMMQLKDHLLKLAKEDAEKQAQKLGKKLGSLVGYTDFETESDGSYDASSMHDSSSGHIDYPEINSIQGGGADSSSSSSADFEMIKIRQRVKVTYSLH